MNGAGITTAAACRSARSVCHDHYGMAAIVIVWKSMTNQFEAVTLGAYCPDSRMDKMLELLKRISDVVDDKASMADIGVNCEELVIFECIDCKTVVRRVMHHDSIVDGRRCPFCENGKLKRVPVIH